MTSISTEIERIFIDNWADYSAIFGDSDSRRYISEAEFKRLNDAASSASIIGTSTFQIRSFNPRHHIQQARSRLAEMQAAHDRLFNTLDSVIAWDNALSAADTQVAALNQDAVTKRIETQRGSLRSTKERRGKQREWVVHATSLASRMIEKYGYDPFKGASGNVANQVHYDQLADNVRLADYYGQQEALNVADFYDQIAGTGMAAEAVREELERDLAQLTRNNIFARGFLLGFDFTQRVVQALVDVFESAKMFSHSAQTLWGFCALEKTLPGYSGANVFGWYFALADVLWPTWTRNDKRDTANMLLSDRLLDYFDKADGLLSMMESGSRYFENNAQRALFKVRLTFERDANGMFHATLTAPGLYRYQEVSAVYLRGMPADVQHVSCRRRALRVTFAGAASSAAFEAAAGDTMWFGADGGLGGGPETFALEGECLIAAHAGNQPLTLSCRSAGNASFTVDCILRIAGLAELELY